MSRQTSRVHVQASQKTQRQPHRLHLFQLPWQVYLEDTQKNCEQDLCKLFHTAQSVQLIEISITQLCYDWNAARCNTCSSQVISKLNYGHLVETWDGAISDDVSFNLLWDCTLLLLPSRLCEDNIPVVSSALCDRRAFNQGVPLLPFHPHRLMPCHFPGIILGGWWDLYNDWKQYLLAPWWTVINWLIDSRFWDCFN